MNVAIATAAAVKPLTVMTARNSDAVEPGAGIGTPSAKDPASVQTDSLSGRYTKTAYRFDAEASRLVLLFRNPEDGATLDQIPTEAALRQYREAQKGRKSGKASLELVVGGSDGQDQQMGVGHNGAHQGAAATHRGMSGQTGTMTGRTGVSHGSSAPTPSVVVSTPMTTHAAPAAAPIAASGGGVNMVV